MKLIYLDTETTGLVDPGLIQLAYIVSEDDKNGGFKKDLVFNKMFKNEKTIDFGAMATHHITPKILEVKGEFLETYKENIENNLKDSICIAHNTPFDKGVLENENIENTKFWLDTKNIAYYLLPEAERYNLQYLRYYLGLEFEQEINPHDALSDIIVLRALFEKLAVLEANKLKTETIACTDFKNIYPEELKTIIKQFYKWSANPLLLRNITFGLFKGMDFADIKELDTIEYRKLNKTARAGQTGLDYLEYLYGAETKKPEDEQNRDLVYTLSFYLNKVL